MSDLTPLMKQSQELRKHVDAISASLKQGRVIFTFCPRCGINTNHKTLENGNVICWCGYEHGRMEPK